MDTAIKHDRGFPIPKIGDGHKITSLEDVSAFVDLELSDKTLPVVLHVLNKDNFLHTALVLGTTDNGDWLVWEKRGYSIAFRLATLNQVFEEYNEYSPTWVLRPLKSVEA